MPPRALRSLTPREREIAGAFAGGATGRELVQPRGSIGRVPRISWNRSR